MNSRYDRATLRHFITSDDIRTASLRGDTVIAVRDNYTVTDEGRELALKLGLSLDMPGQAHVAAPTASDGQSGMALRQSTVAPAALKTLPDDTACRVAEAISAVLGELKLEECAASIAPVLTRRVFASLAKAAERR